MFLSCDNIIKPGSAVSLCGGGTDWVGNVQVGNVLGGDCPGGECPRTHYSDVILGTIASQITSLIIAYSTVYSYAEQTKHQSSTSMAFVWGIHRRPVNFPHKWPVTRKMFPFDDVIMHCIYRGGMIVCFIGFKYLHDNGDQNELLSYLAEAVIVKLRWQWILVMTKIGSAILVC